MQVFMLQLRHRTWDLCKLSLSLIGMRKQIPTILVVYNIKFGVVILIFAFVPPRKIILYNVGFHNVFSLPNDTKCTKYIQFKLSLVSPILFVLLNTNCKPHVQCYINIQCKLNLIVTPCRRSLGIKDFQCYNLIYYLLSDFYPNSNHP